MNWDDIERVQLSMLGGIFRSMLEGPPPIIGRDTVEGNIIVSTIKPYDLESYETALIDGPDDAVIVERYETEEEALKGHARWVEKARPGLIVVDPGFPGTEEITAKPHQLQAREETT